MLLQGSWGGVEKRAVSGRVLSRKGVCQAVPGSARMNYYTRGHATWPQPVKLLVKRIIHALRAFSYN